MVPNSLKKIISFFKRFPGIGDRTAERMSIYMIDNFSKEEIQNFSKKLYKLNDVLKKCNICHVISDNEICNICNDKTRDNILMIVENSIDAFHIQKTNTYYGYFHILGGLINFSKGIDVSDLNIDDISLKLKNIDEVIISTNATIEGEITASYLKDLISSSSPNIKITRLAFGIPVGSELKYTDQETLRLALINRRDI